VIKTKRLIELSPDARARLSAVLWWTPECAVIGVSLMLASLFTAWFLVPGVLAGLRIGASGWVDYAGRLCAAERRALKRPQESVVIDAEIVALEEVTR
jgi:hypothetical protein